jgi:hypothetical protein
MSNFVHKFSGVHAGGTQRAYSYLTVLRTTETSLYLASLNINAQNVGIVKRELHNMEMSLNEECFLSKIYLKGKSFRNVGDFS